LPRFYIGYGYQEIMDCLAIHTGFDGRQISVCGGCGLLYCCAQETQCMVSMHVVVIGSLAYAAVVDGVIPAIENRACYRDNPLPKR
jgi:hypothetical protein